MTSHRDAEEEKSKRVRTRSGCFTCRDRHMKCDEQLPVCQNCINSKRKCLRGIRLNFTQYTLYDPKELRAISLSPEGPKTYRILDQSIPVASLYKNGLRSYESWRHLHSMSDLQDAHQYFSRDLRLNSGQSSLLMEQAKPIEDANFNELDHGGFIAQAPVGLDPWQYSQTLHENTSFTFTEDTVLENFDIRNLLMNPTSGEAQLQEIKTPSSSIDLQTKYSLPETTPPRRARTRAITETAISPADADNLLILLRCENYFWFLDLFNELGIWKSSVPKYATRLAQTKEHKEGKSRNRNHSHLLLDCLLCCRREATLDSISSACHNQLDLWLKFNSKDVTTTSFKDFERVLISAVLLVLALLLRTISPGFTVTQQFEMILSTQGRLIHKMTARFQRILENTARKLNGYVLTIASFQALVILRFFLQMRLEIVHKYETRPITNKKHNIHDALSLGLNVSMLTEPNCNVSEFFTLSEFELAHLKKKFLDFDLNTSKYISDSAKLRAQFWNLCMLDQYQRIQGVEKGRFFGKAHVEADPSSVLLPNDKCIALNIVSAYADALQDPALDSYQNVHPIFKQIETSLMTDANKANWLNFFGWARNLGS